VVFLIGRMRLHRIRGAVCEGVPYRALPGGVEARGHGRLRLQPRLDWQMWFAAMSGPNEYLWTLTWSGNFCTMDRGAEFVGGIVSGREEDTLRACCIVYFRAPGMRKGIVVRRSDWVTGCAAGSG